MHALIIEDNAITAMMIEDELKDLGFTSVDTAVSEQEAIAADARRCPDLVNSDGSLVGGSGMGAVRKIRSGPRKTVHDRPARDRRRTDERRVIDQIKGEGPWRPHIRTISSK